MLVQSTRCHKRLVKGGEKKMPVKIPITEKREWLKSYEEGVPAASIARKAKRNIKTIKNGIEDALRERDGQVARSELLKGALQKHQDQLIAMMNDILNMAQPPAFDLESKLPILLPGAQVVSDKTHRLILEVNNEHRLEWELLREHLGKNDRLWSTLDQWKKSKTDYIQAKRSLRLKLEGLIGSMTGQEPVKAPKEPPYVYASAVDDIGVDALRFALGIALPQKIESLITVDTKSGEIGYSSGHILAKAPGQEEKFKQDFISVFEELQSAEEMKEAVKTRNKVEEDSARLRRAAEEIVLLGIVPGHCRICRRLGI